MTFEGVASKRQGDYRIIHTSIQKLIGWLGMSFEAKEKH